MQFNLAEIINDIHLEDFGNKNAPSVFINEKNYQILTLKFIKLSEDGLVDDSHIFLFYDNNIYKILDQKNYEQLFGVDDFYTEINQAMLYQILLLKHITLEIDDLEDNLFDRKDLRYFLESWFNNKKELLKFERIMNRIAEVLNEFEKKNNNFFSQIQSEYLDLKEEIEIAKRATKAQLGKLDTLYTYYTSLNNDHVNKNIFALALVSGIFLPLNLIVGFFGMNTSDMFFTSSAGGTKAVMIGLFSVFVLLILGLPIFRKIDEYFFNRIFASNRSELKIKQKISHIEQELKQINSQN